MIPVEQREMFDAETGHRGDCLRCAFASVLELPYEDVPHFAAMGDNWFTEQTNWLAERNLRLLTVWNGAPGEHMTPPMVPSDGYWLAGVVSRRVEHLCGACSPDDPGFMNDGRLCTFCRGWGKRKGGHVIVMKGAEVAWDPHPLREQGHGGFIDAQVFVPLDPSKVTS